MKSQRHARILELVSKYEIETQEDMMSRLQSEGFKVTQATVSRDLKELKLTKTLTARGTYRYAVNTARQHTGSMKLNNAMVDSIIQVDYSLNNVVIKTQSQFSGYSGSFRSFPIIHPSSAENNQL